MQPNIEQSRLDILICYRGDYAPLCLMHKGIKQTQQFLRKE